jgi:hypothetical protein
MSSQFGNMRITRWIAVLMILVGITNTAFSQDSLFQWHGYLQTRFTSDFEKANELSIRRAKLWINGNVPDVSWMTYKVQAVYRSSKDAAIMLQDAYADMQIKSIASVRVGRFKPDFLLQPNQPDYEIPDLERADVVNNMVFNPKTMARQIGAQITLNKQKYLPHLSLGIFSENHDVPGDAKNQNLLFTAHVQKAFVESKDLLVSTGASIGYRYVDSLSMPSISETTTFTGNDLHWGLEGQFQLKKYGLQVEYVQAIVNGNKVWGYYIDNDYYFTNKFQAIAGIEKYADLIPETNDNAWFGVGGNYFFTERTKLMAELKSQVAGNKINYQIEIQFQVFFK